MPYAVRHLCRRAAAVGAMSLWLAAAIVSARAILQAAGAQGDGQAHGGNVAEEPRQVRGQVEGARQDSKAPFWPPFLAGVGVALVAWPERRAAWCACEGMSSWLVATRARGCALPWRAQNATWGAQARRAALVPAASLRHRRPRPPRRRLHRHPGWPRAGCKSRLPRRQARPPRAISRERVAVVVFMSGKTPSRAPLPRGQGRL